MLVLVSKGKNQKLKNQICLKNDFAETGSKKFPLCSSWENVLCFLE